MKYCLLKLNFKTAIHIGCDSGKNPLEDSQFVIHADTIFSALCNEGLQLGKDILDELINMAKNDEILLSDALPYIKEELYIPKPILSINSTAEQLDNKDKKKMKKLKFIPINLLPMFISYMQKKTSIEDQKILVQCNNEFGTYQIRTLAAVRGLEETRPFNLSVFNFNEDCGLYIVIGYKELEQIKLLLRLFKLLGYSGIGGKRFSGLGKFEPDDEIYLEDYYIGSQENLYKSIIDKAADYYMTLTTALPEENAIDEVIENGFYSLVRRGGFVQSQNFATTHLKKKVIYAFSVGSCFKQKFKGVVTDVGQYGNHPVYRYLKPIFMGVNL